MKIGIVTPTFFPYPGGVTEHVHHTYLVLKKLGHDVRVITTSFGRGGRAEPPPDVEGDVIRIGRSVSIPANGSICPVALDFRMARRVREVLDRERFDVVHLHEPFMPALCLAVLREAEVATVGTFHASNDAALGYRLFRPLLESYAKKLTRRIVVSEAARETAASHFDGQYEVIPNGVDVARFAEAEPIPEFTGGGINVLFVGRMEPRKGAKFLFKAFPMILEEVPECRFTVIGGGPFSSYYRSFVPDWCRDRVRFLGYVAGRMVPRHYASADIFCSPATGGESFGIVLLEAMAARAAIVASNIGGYRSVVEDGETGILVRPASPESVAEGIVRLAKDGDLRARLAGNARREVARYAWDTVTAEILRVYEDAIAEHDGGAPPGREEERERTPTLEESLTFR